MIILTTNLLLSTLVFGLAAKLYVLPRLRETKSQTILVPILFFHSFRHLGLMFLAPGATFAGISPRFAYPAALGDLVAAVLAFIALLAVVRDSPAGRGLVWAFNVEGTVDLLVAIALGITTGAPDHMGAAYWIPALLVPALLVTHYITFVVLLRGGRPAASETARGAWA
jgi:hypothetical protein